LQQLQQAGSIWAMEALEEEGTADKKEAAVMVAGTINARPLQTMAIPKVAMAAV
jgi:hypothetical protein